MLPNRSLWVPPTSGFVPFSPAANVDDDVLESPPAPVSARKPAVAHELAPPVAPAERHAMRSMAWQPSTTRAVRRVEAAVLAAVCGYFTLGLGKLLGLL
jgi:hypothetical protein